MKKRLSRDADPIKSSTVAIKITTDVGQLGPPVVKKDDFRAVERTGIRKTSSAARDMRPATRANKALEPNLAISLRTGCRAEW